MSCSPHGSLACRECSIKNHWSSGLIVCRAGCRNIWQGGATAPWWHLGWGIAWGQILAWGPQGLENRRMGAPSLYTLAPDLTPVKNTCTHASRASPTTSRADSRWVLRHQHAPGTQPGLEPGWLKVTAHVHGPAQVLNAWGPQMDSQGWPPGLNPSPSSLG